MGEPFVNSIVIAALAAIFAAMLAFIASVRKQDMKELKESIVQLNVQMGSLKSDMATVTTQVSPLWARVQAQISADLHHPNEKYAEMDGLLEKLESLTITGEERRRLKTLLEERSHDNDEDISPEQRKKATLMITVMDMVLAEKAIASAGDSAVVRLAKIEGQRGESDTEKP